MTDQVPGDVIADRSKVLHRLADDKKRAFYQRQQSESLRVLFEERDSKGRYVGFSDNYVKVGVHTTQDLSNRLGWVRITGSAERTSGRQPLAIGELVDIENKRVGSSRCCPEATPQRL